MNEAIGILTDTGDDMADVIFELLGVTAADMSAFALSVSPMNIKADQYEIASNARLETLEDGTILLVMCEDQDAVFDAIRDTIEGAA